MRRWFSVVLVTLVGGVVHADDPKPATPPPGAESVPAPKAPPITTPAAPAPSAKPAPPPTFEQAADGVIAAIQAKDDAALKALALKDDPDPWLVADELIRRSEHDAAAVFSKALPRKDVERLPAYVASRRGIADNAAAQDAVATADAALRRGDAKTALAALPVGQPDEGTIVAVKRALALGAANRMLARLPEGVTSYIAAADAAERLGWLAAASRALDEAARLLCGSGDFHGAMSVLERRLRLEEARDSRSGQAATRLGMGIVQTSLGNFREALSILERSLDEWQTLRDRRGIAVTLTNLGNVNASIGRHARALELFKVALKEMQELGNKAGAAVTLGNISGVHHALGNFAEALEVGELAMKESDALGDPASAAAMVGNLGIIYYAIGDYARARSAQERALKAQKALRDRAGAAKTLGNLANVHHALGNDVEALELYEQVLTEMKALGDRAGAASVLGNIGVVHSALGNHAGALEDYERAFAVREELGDRAGAARTLGNIGAVYASLGNHEKALGVLGRALDQQRALGDRSRTPTTLNQIARSHEALGEPEKALSAARTGSLLLPALVSGLGEEQSALARAQYGGIFDVGLRATVASSDVTQAAFFVEQGRAGSLLEAFKSRESLRSALIPAELISFEAYARSREAAAVKAYRKSLDAGDREASRALRADMDAAQDAVMEAIERIQREAKRAASVFYPAAASLDAIRLRLGPEDAMVLYALTDTRAFALVVTAMGAKLVTLAATKDVQAACETLHVAIAERADREAVTKATSALRELVVEPVGLASEAKRVLFSPDGALSYVPFALLDLDRVVICVPSATTYGLLLDDDDEHGEGVLAVGDPDYQSMVDGRSAGIYQRGAVGRLVRLPATADEAKAIGTPVLLGKDATEKGLRDAVAKKARWRAVHLACHGLIDAERPAFSSLALTADGDDDGFLTVLEVFRSKFPADLVVLSACETAKGKVVKGEGIMGLTRAFMFAGAPRVICSLWKVDDDATKVLMVKFYELWNPKDGKVGLPTAEALKKAQEFVRSHEKWKHPYYWAAWVLWGLPS